MRFLDYNIKLNIKDKQTKTIYDFKAYLEKSAVQVKTIDTNIQYAPLNFTNNTQFLKTQYSVDFSFNVFAEDRDESFKNYDKLHNLLKIIKPTYKTISDQYLPDAGNIFGLIEIQFSGLPILSKRQLEVEKLKDKNTNQDVYIKRGLDIYITNFAFNINQDMGFLEAPYDPNDTKNKDRDLLVGATNMLVPIAYRVDISGRVLLPLNESINVKKLIIPATLKKTKDAIADKVGNDTTKKDDFKSKLNGFIETSGLTTLEFDNLNANIKQITINSVKALDTDGLLTQDGQLKESASSLEINRYADTIQRLRQRIGK